MVNTVAGGLGASIGVKRESVYGTAVAVDHFYGFDTESMQRNNVILEDDGLYAGQVFRRSGSRVATSNDGGGATTMNVPSTKFGLLVAQALGSTAAPVQQSATTAYLQTHIPATLMQDGTSMTLQKGVPDFAAGLVHSFTYAGGKMTSFTLSCDTDAYLKCSANFDFASETVDGSGANAYQVPSYASAFMYHFGHGTTFTLGGTAGTSGGIVSITGSPVTPALIHSWSITVATPMKTDDRRFGNAVKGEPKVSGRPTITGSISARFQNVSELYAFFQSQASMPLHIKLQGPTAIASTFYPFIDIICPAIFFDGSTPQVGGPDMVDLTVPFTAEYDGTNAAIQVQYESTDVTL